MFMKFCYSCGAPLSVPGFKGPVKNYCRHCTDAQGNIKSKTQVQTAIAGWLKGWQPDIDEEKAMERAGHYMKAMPRWAE